MIVGGTTTQTPGVPTATAPAAATRTGRTGTLALTAKDDDPRFLVFVDGVYVGASDELDGTLTLTPGTHDVQLQADGRPARRFTVRIAAGKTTTHDTDLAGEDERLAEAGRPHTAGPGSHEVAGRSQDVADSGHIYIIAGCYAGNVPPVAATLPAGCDAARLTTLAR